MKYSFKDFIKESIIDIPRRTYAKAIFDNADTDNPKIKSEIIGMIMKQFTEFKKEYPILEYSLIGSILTKRYRNDADLDINILFDVPQEKQEEERLRLSKKYLSASSPDSILGKEIPGTKHPINYYFITDKKTYDEQEKKADAVFDIKNNKFIKRPKEFTFDVNLYVKEFERKVQELDVIKGELKRDIIDYDELKELQPDDILNLQDKINDKLEEIEDGIKDIIKVGDTVDTERRAAFDTDMTPDEIRQYGVKNRLPKNVIYKMLEKYHYLKFYKKCKKILDDGEVTDAEIDSLKEAKNKSIAFTFGRFNPPTIGHEKLINKVASISADDYKVYLSRSQDSVKNPLSPKEKLSVMKSMFPRHSSKIEINNTNMILDIITNLYNKGYTDITMVVGSDRVREFDSILKKYNDVKSRHGYYNFDNIKVVSAGERDPDEIGATGMSASKMRDAAKRGDLKSFRNGVPSNYRDIEGLFKNVRKGMNLAASFGGMLNVTGNVSLVKPIVTLEEFEQNQIRDLYVREMIFNIDDKVKYVKEDIQGIVKRRGTNYVVLEDNNNNLHKAWIWDCIPVASNRDVEVREYDLNIDYGFKAVSNIEEDLDRQPQDKTIGKEKPGTQPKKYYKDLSKDAKEKRADFFKRQKYKKGDTDYKPAPGDKDKETKPSIHTQKYKKMFGEFKKELSDACWKGYKQVGMKDKNGKQVPNCVPEAYEIGHDYAMANSKMTPGEPNYDPNFQGGDYKPSDPKNNLKQVVNTPMTTNIEKKDIEEWAISDSTIDKYRERYKEQWRSKLDEVVKRMMEKIDVKI
jgi:hypothetical protein